MALILDLCIGGGGGGRGTADMQHMAIGLEAPVKTSLVAIDS